MGQSSGWDELFCLSSRLPWQRRKATSPTTRTSRWTGSSSSARPFRTERLTPVAVLQCPPRIALLAGRVSPKGKLPYQVMFYPCTPEGMCGLCGGTIVNKKFVVTAAHCWDSRFTNLRVIVGEHSICDGINEGGKVINVKKGTMHPNYNKKTMDNDIAVLELSEELTFTDKIKPACLPSSA